MPTFFRAASKQNTGNRNPYVNRNAGASTSQENTGGKRPHQEKTGDKNKVKKSSKVKKSRILRMEVSSDEDSDADSTKSKDVCDDSSEYSFDGF